MCLLEICPRRGLGGKLGQKLLGALRLEPEVHSLVDMLMGVSDNRGTLLGSLSLGLYSIWGLNGVPLILGDTPLDIGLCWVFTWQWQAPSAELQKALTGGLSGWRGRASMIQKSTPLGRSVPPCVECVLLVFTTHRTHDIGHLASRAK